jgi:hypothetical protein
VSRSISSRRRALNAAISLGGVIAAPVEPPIHYRLDAPPGRLERGGHGGKTGPLKPWPPREAGRPAGGSAPPGSGGGR